MMDITETMMSDYEGESFPFSDGLLARPSRLFLRARGDALVSPEVRMALSRFRLRLKR